MVSQEDSLSQVGHFDVEQATPDRLVDILRLGGEAIGFYKNSYGDTDSGLHPDEGWMLEVDHPDYVLGSLEEDGLPVVNLVDCHPIIPAPQDSLSRTMFRLYTAVDEVARAHNTRLMDLLREAEGTHLPISVQQMSDLCIKHGS